MAAVSRPRGVSVEDWESFLLKIEDYHASDTDPAGMAEAAEAAETVARDAVRLFLPAN